MINNIGLLKIFDGDYEIIYSSDFNIYENKLVINKIAGFEFEFKFENNSEKQGSPIEIKGDNKGKKITVILFNFNNSLGMGTTKKLPIIKMKDGRQIYFSIHVKSLNESTSFLKISITFYVK